MQPVKPRFACPEPCRRDGWTPARQLAFLEILARTRSVTAAARSVGMSREGAYRLRRRADAGLFAATWDRAMGAGRIALTRAEVDESHRRLIARGFGTERTPSFAADSDNQLCDPQMPVATASSVRTL